MGKNKRLGNTDISKYHEEASLLAEAFDNNYLDVVQYNEAIKALKEEYGINNSNDSPKNNNKSNPKAKNTQEKTSQCNSCDDEVADLKKQNAELKAQLNSAGKGASKYSAIREKSKSTNKVRQKLKNRRDRKINYETGTYNPNTKRTGTKNKQQSSGKMDYNTGTYTAPTDSEIMAEMPKTTQEVKQEKKAIQEVAEEQVEQNTNTNTKTTSTRGRKPSLTPKQTKEIKDKVKAGEQVYAHNTIYNIARRFLLLAKNPSVKDAKNLYIFATKANTAGQWSRKNEGGEVLVKILSRMGDNDDRSVEISENEQKALTQITGDVHIPPSVKLYKSYLNLLKNPNEDKAKALAKKIKNSQKLKYMNAQSLMYNDLMKIVDELEKGNVPKPALSGLGATKCDNAMKMVSGLSEKGIIYKRQKSTSKK